MIDLSWMESPKMQKAFADGKVEGLHSSIVKVVKARFPALTELAQQYTAAIDTLQMLDLLLEQILVVPNEETAGLMLQPSAA